MKDSALTSRLCARAWHDLPDAARVRAQESLRAQILSASPAARCAVVLSLILWHLDRLTGGQLRRLPIFGYLVRTASKVHALHGTVAQTAPAPQSSPLRRPVVSTRIAPRCPRHVETLVIGSGPGAGTAAATLSGSSDVHILEQGHRSPVSPERYHSLEHLLSDFEQGGQQVCLSRPLTQFAQARVLGGGSELNAGLYHDLPADLRASWCAALGVSEEQWLCAQQWVRSLLEVSSPPADANTSIIAAGARALDLEHRAIERWRTYNNNVFEQHGMVRQVWSDSKLRERVHTGHRVVRMSSGPGHVEVHVRSDSGPMIVRAQQVILAAGTTGTPSLLQASGLISTQQVRFNMHPMVRLIAQTSPDVPGLHDIDPFQAWSLDGHIKFGAAVATPELLSIGLGRRLNRDDVQTLRSYYASFVPTGRGGQVGCNPYFRYSHHDRQMLERSAGELASFLRAAGAQVCGDPKNAAANPSTVHIFGSLPVGSQVYLPGTTDLVRDPRISVLDASALPSAPGVNPQGPLMVLARLISERLGSR
jgi:hypothetical protein